MYGQFFGSFLLNVKAVSPQQLATAIADMGRSHIRLGTLAMYKGYMTSDEVDECCFIQRREDKRFGEIALSRSYLFEDQLEDLLHFQTPDYLRLGQTLVDSGALTNASLHDLLVMYNSENEYGDIATDALQDDDPAAASFVEIRNFFKYFDKEVSEYTITYLHLLLNNLVRFLGNDYTPLAPVSPEEYQTNRCIRQRISGEVSYDSRIDMEDDTAITFASRFADMEFDEYDDYVSASMEDFLNLHNGLFCVNMSNNHSLELSLDAPEHEDDVNVELEGTSIIVPVIYPFGTIYLILSQL